MRSAERSCSLPVGRVSVMNSCSTAGDTIKHHAQHVKQECCCVTHELKRQEEQRQVLLGATGNDCDLVNLAPQQALTAMW